MPLGVTDSFNSWTFQEQHVERNLDSSAISAAHPDDTLVLAGPTRASRKDADLLPIGMLQQISFQQNKNTTPLMSIGGGRTFFTSGKATTNWSAARLFVNGRNLLRVLYQNAVSNGLDLAGLDDPAGNAGATTSGEGANAKTTNAVPKYVVNLDSELFYLPFGMACIFRNKQRQVCGSFYLEVCMIGGWGTSINAGSSQIMEQVSGAADRILPWKATGTPPEHTSAATLTKIAEFTG